MRPKQSLLAPIGAAAMLLLAACSGSGSAPASGTLSGTVTVDGSTTVYPLSQALAARFQKANQRVQFSIQFSGTGGGFKKFCDGGVDVSGASRPINAAESTQCTAHHVDFIELPVAFDSLAVVVNAKNTFIDCLTVPELKRLWEPAADHKVTEWNQLRPTLPAEPIELFGPGRASGTFDYFTLAIVGTQSSSRDDYTQSEDDMVIVRGVASTPNALGYLGNAYYQSNKDQLRVLAIDNGKGCTAPSPDAVVQGTYQPLSRPLFIYVNAKSAQRPEVKAFAGQFLDPLSAQDVQKVGYVPLPKATQTKQAKRLDQGSLGSVMGGQGSVTGIIFTWFDDDEEHDRVRNELVQ